MDYNTFGHVLKSRGIESHLAWQDLKVLIEPLPPIGRSVLGLYYPDGDPSLGIPIGTIWIPPDADDETVLHELGHRYGHYQYDDLSEPFAEKFRNKYRNIHVTPRVAAYSVPRISDYEYAVIREQMELNGDINYDAVIYSDIRIVSRRV